VTGEAMPEPSIKPYIASVLFLDIVGYSKQSVENQHDIKQHFTTLLSAVIESLPGEERIAIDTGDGAAICFLANPEVALQVALVVRNRLAQPSEVIPMGYQLCMGINIGPVRVVTDINQQRNVIGDGINVAQRVLGFASPGQILVSSAFHDIVAFLTTDHMNMFRAAGARPDKHGREHNVYEVVEGFDAQTLLDIVNGQQQATAEVGFADDQDASEPARIPEATLQAIETKYAQYVGPIAHVLVQKGVSKASGAEGLCTILSDMIDDAVDRRAFRDFFFSVVGRASEGAGKEGLAPVEPVGTNDAQAISGAHLAAIEAMLTQHIGPIASVVIKRHAASSSSIETLCDNLAQHIESEEKQQRFIEQATRLLDG
jgi:class 3 adenylate cyclase